MRKLRWIVLALVAAFGVTLPSYASPSNGFGPKVDDALAELATAPDASAGTELHVLIFGDHLASVNSALGLRVREGFDKFGGEGATITVGDLPALVADDDVDYVTVDRDVVPTATTTPTADMLATLYPTIDGAPAAWGRGYTGAGVGIAIIDSGTTPEPDFGGRLIQVKLKGQIDKNGGLNDPYGHGTFVAGIAAGATADSRYVGIAPAASIYAINVSRPDGVRSSDVMAGLIWVLMHHKDRHIRVVNLSLNETATSSYLDSPLDSVVEMLWRAGVVVVVSSGNRGPNTASYAPANDPFVISVGATDTNGTIDPADDTVARFSSYGTTRDGFSKPEIVAPGRRIVSLLPAGTVLGGQAPVSSIIEPGYARMSGTSFAAPQVTGAVAALLQKNPSLTPNQVKALLTATSRPVAESAAGALDLDAASAFGGDAGVANQGIEPARFGAPPQLSGSVAPPSAPSVPDLPTTNGYTPPAKPDIKIPAAVTSKVLVTPLPTAPSLPKPILAPCLGEGCAAAMALDTAAATLKTADAWAAAAQAWDNLGYFDHAAVDWEACASSGGRTPVTPAPPAAWNLAAVDWERIGSLTRGAVDREKAGAFNEAAADWERASAPARAALDYEKLHAWQSAAIDWELAGGPDRAAVDWERAAAWDNAAADWERAAAWDKAVADWERAAAWDKAAAAWERAAAWDKAAADWQRAASWDNAARVWEYIATGFDRAAAWDKASAAWMSAAAAWASAGDSGRAAADRDQAAAEWERVAVGYERSAAWDNARSAWENAADVWQKLSDPARATVELVRGAVDMDAKAVGYERAAAWDRAAGAWKDSAAAWVRSAAWDRSAAAWQRMAAAWEKRAAWDKSAAAWEGASAAWVRSAAWDKSASALEMAAAVWDKSAAWDVAAAEWEKAAGAQQRAGSPADARADWQRAANDWHQVATAFDKAAAWDKAAAAWDRCGAAWDRSAAWDKAAAAWDTSAADWATILVWDKSAAELNLAAYDWAQAGAWDKASIDWALAAARDPSPDWNLPSGADAAAAWARAANAWYDSAAWD